MPRPSTIPALLEELKTYLDLKDAEWEQGDRLRPTLPVAHGGKVNVRALMREFGAWAEERGVDVPDSAWQYVYSQQEWAREIDAVAQAQGLTCARSRAPDSADDAAHARIARLGKEVKDQSEGHAQARARIAHLERQLADREAENRRLRERFALMQRTGTILRTDDVT
ncbi:MAG TPA: hypothetical protein VIL09_07160 [Microvirga sp.]|jgi:uncharacterized protein YlxW (UPF0749 family)